MPEQLTQADFAPLLRQVFSVDIADARLTMELVCVERLGSAPSSGRQPFSLLFRGPLEPLLPQHIYVLQHSALGTLEMFLVPIGPDEHGQRYQAIFS
jgi:hypothetical protein